MGYYVRFLTPNTSQVAPGEIAGAVNETVPDAVLSFSEEDNGWSSCEVSRGGNLLSVVTRDIDSAGSTLVAEEVAEFADKLEDTKPQNASRWVQDRLKDVKTIYAFQILGACESNADWDAVGAFQQCLQTRLGGITQADGEGFSNEDGYQIVWQFSDGVSGSWNMAVLAEAGGWIKFKMDWGKPEHRQAFWDGKVPAGCAI